MRPSPHLLRAFLDAHYEVRLPSAAVTIKLGQCVEPLDALAPAHGCWALLQAGCPRSAPWPERLNRRRLELLETRLRRNGLHYWPASGSAPDGSWIESGLCVMLASPQQADAYACRFGQHAMVLGGGGRVARLRCHGRRWHDLAGSPTLPVEVAGRRRQQS